MPKKPRPPKPDGPPPLNNKDHLERANYAMQASLLLRQLGVNRAQPHGDEISATSATARATTRPQPVHLLAESGPSQLHAGASGECSADGETRVADGSKSATRSRKWRTTGGKEPLGDLSRTEVSSMRKWTVHNQVKLDPAVKRSLCPCGTVLVPGLTSRVRVKPSRQHKHRLVTSCLQCGHSSSVPMAKSSWSNRERPVPVEPSPEEQPQQPGSAPDPEKVDGHVIWAGGQRIVGWGEMSAPAG